MTLTEVGESWQGVRCRRARLHQRLVRAGYHPEMAWAVECASKRPSHHLHALGWGSLPDATTLSHEAAAVGWGHRVDVRPVVNLNVAGYLMKQAIPLDGQLEHFLAMNGGRLLHTTRGFWRDGADGPAIKGGLAAALLAAPDWHRPRVP